VVEIRADKKAARNRRFLAFGGAHAVKSKRHQRSHVLSRTPNTSAIDSHDAAFTYTLRVAKPCSLNTAVHGIKVWTEGGEA
ncbi:unnamed protein product, partial [Musa acuminata subsp. burmannicoides]